MAGKAVEQKACQGNIFKCQGPGPLTTIRARDASVHVRRSFYLQH